MPGVAVTPRPLCDECNAIVGTNPDCENCQDFATQDADRTTAKAGATADRQMGAPRAFSSSGRVD